VEEEPEMDPEVAEMMGFGGFGSSKNSWWLYDHLYLCLVAFLIQSLQLCNLTHHNDIFLIVQEEEFDGNLSRFKRVTNHPWYRQNCWHRVFFKQRRAGPLNQPNYKIKPNSRSENRVVIKVAICALYLQDSREPSSLIHISTKP